MVEAAPLLSEHGVGWKADIAVEGLRRLSCAPAEHVELLNLNPLMISGDDEKSEAKGLLRRSQRRGRDDQGDRRRGCGIRAVRRASDVEAAYRHSRQC